MNASGVISKCSDGHTFRPAVFLDRDGVLNRALVRKGRPYPPACVADVEILPGVPAALQALRQAGFLLVVVTNQPDVARGKTPLAAVETIQRHLQAEMPLDAFYTCLHDDADRCRCRKPLPGLLLSAAVDLRIDLAASYMVGDRWRDMEAGRQAGCRTVFVDYGYSETLLSEPAMRATSSAEALARILTQIPT